MISLPNEVWYEVLSYLSEGEADLLMAVNRVFYHCVWNRRYREVSLLKATPYAVKRTQMLLDPKVATHVRSLLLQLSELEYFELSLRACSKLPPPPSLPSSASSQKTIGHIIKTRQSWLSQLLACFSKGHVPNNDIPTAPPFTIQQLQPMPVLGPIHDTSYMILKELIQGLSNVDTLAIHWQGTGIVRHVPPLLQQMWSMMNLRHLSLQVGAGGLHVALVGVPESMSLESLTILFPKFQEEDPFRTINFGVRNSEATTESMLALVKLINASRHTLVSLKIRCQTPISLDDLFSRLPFIPVLTTLQLKIPYSITLQSMLVNADVPLFTFLGSHNNSLRHLSLNFPGLSQSIIEYLELTNLRTLEITPFSPHNRVLSNSQLSRCVSLNALTLTRLVLLDCSFTFEDLSNLFGREGWARLTSLSINILTFDLAPIRLFIAKLPSLLELVLTYVNDNFVTGPGLAHASFPAWTLYDVTLIDTMENVSYRRMKDMAFAIPSIRSFCGSDVVYEAAMNHFKHTGTAL